MKRFTGLRAAVVAAAVLLSSCIGAKSEITIRKDGSGLISMEYRVSQDLLDLSFSEPGASLPILPVAEEDFRRTVRAIPGLSLKKFDTKRAGEDTVYRLTLGFDSLDALAAFLRPQSGGGFIGLSRSSGGTTLRWTFSPGLEPEGDTGLAALVPLVFEGYEFGFALKTPGPCTVSWLDERDALLPSPPAGEASVAGSTVSFVSPMADIVLSEAPVIMEVSW